MRAAVAKARSGLCDGADAVPPEDDVDDGNADDGEGTAAAERGAGDKGGCGVVGAPASGLVLAWSTVLAWGRRRRETVG